jgi:hypothetical protein
MKIRIVIAALFVCVSTAQAEDVKISTYYPSPEGDYKRLRTTSQTDLATSESLVTVGMPSNGTARATQDGRTTKLDVQSGNVITDDVYLANPRTGAARWASSSWDYDSGWVNVNNYQNRQITLTHNLNIYPTEMQIWFRPVGFSTIYPVKMGSVANWHEQPYTVQVSTTNVVMEFWNGGYNGANDPAGHSGQYKGGLFATWSTQSVATDEWGNYSVSAPGTYWGWLVYYEGDYRILLRR